MVDSEIDVLVIGAGAAGLTAALAAHESGASVRLIEKQDQLGGDLRRRGLVTRSRADGGAG